MVRALVSSAMSVGFYAAWRALPDGPPMALTFALLITGPGVFFGVLVLWPDLWRRGRGWRGLASAALSSAAFFAAAATIVSSLDGRLVPVVLAAPLASGVAAICVAATQEWLRGAGPTQRTCQIALAAGLLSGLLVALLDAAGSRVVPSPGPVFAAIFIVWQLGVAYALAGPAPAAR